MGIMPQVANDLRITTLTNLTIKPGAGKLRNLLHALKPIQKIGIPNGGR